MRQSLNNQRGGIGRMILTFFLFVSFFGVMAVVGVVTWKRLLREFPATKVARHFLENHPQIEEKIGKITKWDDTPSGSFDYGQNGGSGHLKLNLIGEKGKGTVLINFINDEEDLPWRVEDMTLLSSSKGKKGEKLDSPKDWYARVMNALEARNKDEAKKWCDLINKAVPEDEKAVFCTAEEAYSAGEMDKYVEVKKGLAEKYPNDDYYRSLVGYAYYEAGKMSEAIAEYQKAWELRPTLETATKLATLYLDEANNEEAQKWLKAGNEINSTSPELTYLHGRWAYNLGKYNEAIGFFEDSKELAPLKAEPFFGLAYCYISLKRNTDAIYFFEQGLARAPGNSLKHRRKVISLLLDINYKDDAIYHLLKLLDYHSQDVGAYVILAATYRQQGRQVDADRVLAAANEIDPEKVQAILSAADRQNSVQN